MMWKKNNLFGFLAFCAYGFFWLSLILLLTLPKLGLAAAPDGASMGTYFLTWCIFTIGMTVGSFAKAYRALSALFITVVILFLLLSISEYTDGS